MTRFSKKLNDRMLDSFKIIEKINAFYRLKLSLNTYQYNIFSFNYLKLAVNDSLSSYKQELSRLIIVDNEKA